MKKIETFNVPATFVIFFILNTCLTLHGFDMGENEKSNGDWMDQTRKLYLIYLNKKYRPNSVEIYRDQGGQAV